jgi:hypothetical protein
VSSSNVEVARSCDGDSWRSHVPRCLARSRGRRGCSRALAEPMRARRSRALTRLVTMAPRLPRTSTASRFRHTSTTSSPGSCVFLRGNLAEDDSRGHPRLTTVHLRLCLADNRFWSRVFCSSTVVHQERVHEHDRPPATVHASKERLNTVPPYISLSRTTSSPDLSTPYLRTAMSSPFPSREHDGMQLVPSVPAADPEPNGVHNGGSCKVGKTYMLLRAFLTLPSCSQGPLYVR